MPSQGPPGLLLSVALGGLFVLLSVAGMFVPGLALLAPLPVVWAYLRHGASGGLTAALFGGAAYFLLGGQQAGLLSGLLAAAQQLAPALLMGAALVAGAGAGTVVLAGTTGQIVAYLLLMAAVNRQSGINLATEIGTAIREVSQRMPPALLAAQGLDPATYATEMAERVQLVFPALIAVSALLSMAVTFWLMRVLFVRLGQPIPPAPPFGQWRLPGILIWLWLPTFAMMGFGDYGGRLAVNALLLLSAAYWLQGAAVGQFFLVQRLHRALAAFLLAVVAFLPPVTWILTLVGISDAVFDFRRLRAGAGR